ncbi:hypothetical protein M2459_001418 [Parabacteroides sp. PF5-5]|nr:hypothetical protein [Parabacteroides sp. PH5-39]MDH6315704.1 hypothetical protein [Parabacteroides sp. PF5-13]MDH6319364.1 hypothetical protein [Parabacteroides sp. PH5-13]MDH6323095.1 hypothetical protein [Parabacteroides sp. PH5-8]MDH6326897.1 hypothetical protein [Parabacteroides sp. PH5-41]MDH6334674.1 hypothetical protein [Parabacteroides sp. PF5-5]MDH6345738.1 hypothetical protein [Parabacteroides sp. PH5-46]MDH6360694.1 hypothetical protein [Parabacteroides sp. PH5-16]MDH6376384.
MNSTFKDVNTMSYIFIGEKDTIFYVFIAVFDFWG